jgi:hypothetical protein
MKIFIATSFSKKVDYSTGKVYPEFRQWLEGNVLKPIKELGLDYFCAIEREGWVINSVDPAQAITENFNNLKKCDMLLVILDQEVSAGLQMEIGIAYERKMPTILAHEKDVKPSWYNQTLIDAGFAKELILPITKDKLSGILKH